ncbi:hypothetical protein CIK05_11970 [Bdellovibrio sp. qaytius]|nr:hypothetical protein CIK05_11970 [Bdellovibrio sp. qaytius]
MNDFVFKRKHLILMIIAFLTLSISCFIVMGEFFEKATSDLLKVWLNTEQVSLDQGNYISSFSKLQRSIHEDSYIKGFSVTDSDGREVFATGERFPVSSVSYSNHTFIVVHRGFFSNVQQAQFSKLRMTVYSSANELMYIYLMIVGYIVILSSVFVFFLKRIVAREEQIKNETELLRLSEIATINEALSTQAKQVAHDIRSPLSVLNMIVPLLTDASDEKKDLINQAVERINSIASELLSKRTNANSYGYKINPQNLVEKIINEKKVVLNKGVVLKHDIVRRDLEISSKLKESELERMLSNLINNSIEAVDLNKGQILCSFLTNENYFEFVVVDNGKGIPHHLIDKLGQKGASFGKESHTSSGTGLGLFHAKNAIEAVGGKLVIVSPANQGTIVKIQLPKVLN